jgi:cell shape-determining protein MreC
VPVESTNERDVIYKKIKHLKTYGWVDFDFKNPNTIANKRKTKIAELEAENKELKEYKKKAERYFSYLKKINSGIKLTKPQQEWVKQFINELMEE